MTLAKTVIKALVAIIQLSALSRADSPPLNVTSSAGKLPSQTVNGTTTSVSSRTTGVNDLLASALASAYANAGPGGYKGTGNRNGAGGSESYQPPFAPAALPQLQGVSNGRPAPQSFGDSRPNFREYPRECIAFIPSRHWKFKLGAKREAGIEY
jgi:hypothetical protein